MKHTDDGQQLSIPLRQRLCFYLLDMNMQNLTNRDKCTAHSTQHTLNEWRETRSGLCDSNYSYIIMCALCHSSSSHCFCSSPLIFGLFFHFSLSLCWLLSHAHLLKDKQRASERERKRETERLCVYVWLGIVFCLTRVECAALKRIRTYFIVNRLFRIEQA